MTTNKNLVLVGAAALVVGLFCPIVTLPFLGNVNLFNDGTNLLALAILALAAIAGAMALNGRERDAFWPGAAAGLLLIYHFVTLQYRLSQMRSSLDELKDNPFAGLAKTAVGTIQLQWGWLVLAVGAGLLIYAGIKARREIEQPLLSADDGPAKTVAAISILLAIGVIAWTLFGSALKPAQVSDTSTANTLTASSADPDLPGTESEEVSAEEAAYIRSNIRLYDFSARYYDSMLDGRVPGVDFKLKNNGTRTLNRVTVKVVFQDAQGKPIAEEEYSPVWVVENSFSTDDNKPLRANYIWQNEKGQFYTAKSVPSEWAEGKATATITNIEFAPGN